MTSPLDMQLQEFQERNAQLEAEVSQLRNTVQELRQVQRTAGDRLRSLSEAVEQNPASVVITNLDGHIEYVNPKFYEITGYSSGEVLGQNPRILRSGLTPEQSYVSLWDCLRNGREWRGEFVNRKKNGELYCESAVICPIRDGDGRITHYLGVKEDITSQKEAERALREIDERKFAERLLRESEQRLRHVADLAGEWIWEVDADGVCRFSSGAVERVLGYSADEVIGMNFFEQTPQEMLRAKPCFSAAVKRRRPIKSFSIQLLHRSGTAVLLEGNAEPIVEGTTLLGWRGLFRDITAKKQAESATVVKHGLALLHAHDELSQIDTFDELCKRAVELIRTHLGVFRASLWLYDINGKIIRGTFGTDEQGNIRDERHIVLESDTLPEHLAQWIHILQSNPNARPQGFIGRKILRNHIGKDIGEGTLLTAPVWEGRRLVGALFADNYGDTQDPTQADLDWMTLYGAMVGILLGRCRAQEQLAEAQSLLMAAIEQSPAGIIIAEAPSGNIRIANSSAFKIRGGQTESLVNIPFEQHLAQWQVFQPDGSPLSPDENILLKAAREGITSRNVESVIVNEDGEGRYLLANAAPVLDARGQIIAAIIVFTDITERKQAEAELEKYRQHLEELVSEQTRALRAARDELEKRVEERTADLCEANIRLLDEALGRKKVTQALEAQRVLRLRADRLVSLGQMAGGIAHELNQPLVGVRGLAEHLLIARQRSWNLSNEDVEHSLHLIMEQADRMSHVIDHVRRFAREAGRGQAQPVQLNEVALSCLELLRTQFQSHGLDIEMELAEHLPYILANPFSLEEIIYNLLNNARDAVEEKYASTGPSMPPIRIRTERQDRDGKSYACLQVIDQGTGIPENLLEHLFEPFFTTKEPDRGTGLGLPICEAIVKEWGGFIEVSSVPGEGTAFTALFPADSNLTEF